MKKAFQDFHRPGFKGCISPHSMKVKICYDACTSSSKAAGEEYNRGSGFGAVQQAQLPILSANYFHEIHTSFTVNIICAL